MNDKFRKFFNVVTEAHRAAAEWGGMKIGWPFVQRRLPKGDGHPVLFFPGFLTTDGYTSALRERVEEAGFRAYTWEGGFNLGFDEETAAHVAARLREVYAQNGGRKVSLVGYSLGGFYARELAREYPEMVRAVVTLGTPAGMVGKPGSSSPALEQLYALFNPKSEHENLDLQIRGATPPPVPTTGIYSKLDGIVWWESCLNPAAPQTENIEVRSGHLGMIANMPAVIALMDRLAQKEGDWRPFDGSKYGAEKYPAVPANDDLPANPQWTAQNAKSRPLFGKPK